MKILVLKTTHESNKKLRQGFLCWVRCVIRNYHILYSFLIIVQTIFIVSKMNKTSRFHHCISEKLILLRYVPCILAPTLTDFLKPITLCEIFYEHKAGTQKSLKFQKVCTRHKINFKKNHLWCLGNGSCQ